MLLCQFMISRVKIKGHNGSFFLHGITFEVHFRRFLRIPQNILWSQLCHAFLYPSRTLVAILISRYDLEMRRSALKFISPVNY